MTISYNLVSKATPLSLQKVSMFILKMVIFVFITTILGFNDHNFFILLYLFLGLLGIMLFAKRLYNKVWQFIYFYFCLNDTLHIIFFKNSLFSMVVCFTLSRWTHGHALYNVDNPCNKHYKKANNILLLYKNYKLIFTTKMKCYTNMIS